MGRMELSPVFLIISILNFLNQIPSYFKSPQTLSQLPNYDFWFSNVYFLVALDTGHTRVNYLNHKSFM